MNNTTEEMRAMSLARKEEEKRTELFLLNSEIGEDGRERVRDIENHKFFTLDETRLLVEKLKEAGIHLDESEENLAAGNVLAGVALTPGHSRVIWKTNN